MVFLTRLKIEEVQSHLEPPSFGDHVPVTASPVECLTILIPVFYFGFVDSRIKFNLNRGTAADIFAAVNRCCRIYYPGRCAGF